MPKPNLPVVLVKDDRRLTASTPAEYVDLVYKGFVVDQDAEENLSPQQKAARTRAANRARDEGSDETVGNTSDNPDEDITAQAGDANPDA